MKKLEELGINAYPWKADGNNVSCKEWDSSHSISFDHTVADCYRHANARLIAAAPELYDYLVQCVKSIEYILDWQNVDPVVEDNTRAIVVNAKYALAMAAGEEVA